MSFLTILSSTMLLALLAAAPADASPQQPQIQSQSGPSMTVTPSPLTSGSSATISYSNQSLAGHVVIINVDNGMRHTPLTATIEILLDANGKGTASWTVPPWFGANFNAPGVPETHAPIV